MIVWVVVLVLVLLFGGVAFVGAPYVPSHRRQVRRAFTELRPLTAHDVVVDLGSGDGVVLAAAREAGAGRVVGYELNPLLVLLARLRLRQTAEVHLGDMWRVQPPEGTTVVYVFGVGRDMARLDRLMERWTRTLGHPVDLIIYGHELPDRPAARQVGAHTLYTFLPLHPE